jgi:hypothetical protein
MWRSESSAAAPAGAPIAIPVGEEVQRLVAGERTHVSEDEIDLALTIINDSLAAVVESTADAA